VSGAAALACTLLYGWRSLRWQGWRVADVPLLLPMHLGFAWLLLAFALKAVGRTDWRGCRRRPGCTPSPSAASA
jgi:uncharacterized protein involved in response to NO